MNKAQAHILNQIVTTSDLVRSEADTLERRTAELIAAARDGLRTDGAGHVAMGATDLGALIARRESLTGTAMMLGVEVEVVNLAVTGPFQWFEAGES